jgi:hypothetical protein
MNTNHPDQNLLEPWRAAGRRRGRECWVTLFQALIEVLFYPHLSQILTSISLPYLLRSLLFQQPEKIERIIFSWLFTHS